MRGYIKIKVLDMGSHKTALRESSGERKALPLARKDGEFAARLAASLGQIYMASEQILLVVILCDSAPLCEKRRLHCEDLWVQRTAKKKFRVFVLACGSASNI